MTILDRRTAEIIGFPESMKSDDARFDSVTGEHAAYLVRLPRIIAIGREATDYVVAAKSFPPRLQVDGVLGLDFFAGCDLTVGLRTGQIAVEW